MSGNKNGAPISDGGTISGTRTPSLTLSNVLGGDAGAYTIVLSNSQGSMTSAVAQLSILDPFVYIQPVDQVCQLGDNTT